MIIEQTVEITENGWFHLSLPPDVPVGASAKIVITVPVNTDAPLRLTPQEAIEKCSGLTGDSGLTSDKFLEMRRKDRELEEAQHRKLFRVDGDR